MFSRIHTLPSQTETCATQKWVQAPRSALGPGAQGLGSAGGGVVLGPLRPWEDGVEGAGGAGCTLGLTPPGLLVQIPSICLLGSSLAIWRSQARSPEVEEIKPPSTPPSESWGWAHFLHHRPFARLWAPQLVPTGGSSLATSRLEAPPPLHSPAGWGSPHRLHPMAPRLCVRESQLTTLQVTHSRNMFLLMPGKLDLKCNRELDSLVRTGRRGPPGSTELTPHPHPTAHGVSPPGLECRMRDPEGDVSQLAILRRAVEV